MHNKNDGPSRQSLFQKLRESEGNDLVVLFDLSALLCLPVDFWEPALQELRADVAGGLLAPVLWPKPLGRAILHGLHGSSPPGVARFFTP